MLIKWEVMTTLEIVKYSVKKHISPEHLMVLSEEFEKILSANTPGFIRRCLTIDVSSQMYIEMIWWDSMESALMALDTVTMTEAFKNYCSILVDDGSNENEYFQSLSK